MDLKLSEEQINQVVRAARVLAPGFNSDQLEWLIAAQQHLVESGFCEAAWGLVRLQQERGVTCAEALDAHERVLLEKDERQKEVDHLKEDVLTLKKAKEEAREENQRIKEETEQAKKELANTKAETKQEEMKLEALREKERKEEARVNRQVDSYRQKVNISKEEIAAAAQLKKELTDRGLTLELVLRLSQEFAGYEDASKGLAEALKSYRSLSEYLAALKKQTTDEDEKQQSQLKVFQSTEDQMAAQLRQMRGTCRDLESHIAQLRADVAREEEMRRFYYRYQGLSPLLEYIATWDQVFFFRCNNPLSAMAAAFDPSALGPRIITDKLFGKCPHCGLPMAFDQKLYQALNLPVGFPTNLNLDDNHGEK